jgi:hypothetical protein
VDSCGLGVEWASEVSELLRVRGAGARKGRRAEVDLGLLLALERHVYHVYIYIDTRLALFFDAVSSRWLVFTLVPHSPSPQWSPLTASTLRIARALQRLATLPHLQRRTSG